MLSVNLLKVRREWGIHCTNYSAELANTTRSASKQHAAGNQMHAKSNAKETRKCYLARYQCHHANHLKPGSSKSSYRRRHNTLRKEKLNKGIRSQTARGRPQKYWTPEGRQIAVSC
jgi:hypothetical protein